MTLVITRLHGKRVVCGQVPLSEGPLVWVGEYRNDDDSLISSDAGSATESVYGVRVAFDLPTLIRALDRAGAPIPVPLRRRRKAVREGHPEGTKAVNEALNRR